ncbi:MAG: DUF1700 domain-containing protein [Bdellovibrio sp.]|nr:DUF1700 domain-containing protein [Bdellovibrio sp.]
MNKNEFILALRSALQKNGVKDIDDIASDYEEHFQQAKIQGKNEDEVSRKLGTPEVIAKAYETDSMVLQMKDTSQPFKFTFAFKVLGRLIVLAPFNFLILLIPGSIILAIVVIGWALTMVTGASALAIVTTGLQANLINLSAWVGVSIFSTTLALFGLTAIFILGMMLITKSIVVFAINYLRWNLKFVLQK